MKNRFSIACALLLSASLTLQANPITRAEARLVAHSLVGVNDTSTDEGAPVAPYYIFSRGAGRGFVIVSGDDSTAPILGCTDRGDFSPDSLPPQLQSMLTLWGDRISQLQQRPQPQQRRISAPRRAVAAFKKDWTDVTPLIKTHWHQDAPYNNLAPVKEGQGRCMTGCVATAGSQVTYYFHKDNPSELAYDTPTYSYGTPVTVSLPKGTPIDWDLMKLSGKGTARQDSAVAKLMYALGTSAWLTYGDGDGLATSGHNNKMAEAMKGQFRLNYSYKSKSEYSQQKWEELIYKNLTEKRPMLYSGVHPDNGGHSVVLDGYQASTGLYHFNFGWGGQGDGYYTVDDATGMNGFNTYQDLVFNITPQVQNLAATANVSQFYHKATTNLEVTVTNNGTLDYQGIYIYLGTIENKVTTSAVGHDLSTVMEPDKSYTLTFAVTPATQSAKYLQVCGKNRTIIASIPIEIANSVAALHLNSISVDAGTAVTTVDDINFRHVNNTTATVTATLTNGKGGTYCQPSVQCQLQQYDTETKTWSNVKNISQNTYIFDEGQTLPVEFAFNGLSEGVLYRACIGNKAVASTASDIQMDTDETYTYFTVREADLTVAIDGRNATVTGRWNAKLFASQATDAGVTSYDISGLTELGEKPQAANPNALFYTTEGDTAVAAIENVVVGDVCQRLVVRMGSDFKPLRPFTAREAQMVLTDAAPGKWHAALIPFAADVPYGMQMKQAKSYVESGLATIDHEATRSLSAMTVATYLTSRTGLNTLTATDATITTDTTVTLFDGVLRAHTVSTDLEPQSLVLGEYAASLYYVEPPAGQTTLDAFQPVVTGTKETSVRTTSETLVDGYYRSLSSTIDDAYSALAENPRAPKAAIEALKAEIAVAQDMLTYRTHKENTDVKSEREKLTKAIKTFRDTPPEETKRGDVNGDGVVDVADIATIISVMANGTEPQSGTAPDTESGTAPDTESGTAPDTESGTAPDTESGTAPDTADVNGDGTVDVADIATVIAIMAGKGG